MLELSISPLRAIVAICFVKGKQMLNIHVSTLAHMEKAQLKAFLKTIGMDEGFFVQKLGRRIWDLEMLITEACSIPGDTYTKTRANKACEKFAQEIQMCKRVIDILDFKQENGPAPFSKADIKRLAREAKLAREAEEIQHL